MKQENYRPIPLMSSCYKLYAVPLQTRTANTIDRDLQRTEFGSRRSRSTVISLACARRICERAEAAEEELRLVFLDWEKASSKIDHDQLMFALESFAFPPKQNPAIKSFYTNPQLAVKIENKWVRALKTKIESKTQA